MVISHGRNSLLILAGATKLNVSGIHPILEAIDNKAAHLDECSCSDVKTIRTARSRTSGEYVIFRLLANYLKIIRLAADKPGLIQSYGGFVLCGINEIKLLVRQIIFYL